MQLSRKNSPFAVNLGFILRENISELNDILQSVILNEAKRNQSLASGLGLVKSNSTLLIHIPKIVMMNVGN
jgi:hypothetical protein